MSRAIITVGIPASGKTTWARETAHNNDNIVIVSRDDIRRTYGWDTGVAEKRVTEIHRNQMEAAFLAGKDVIVADTNLNKDFRKRLVKFCHEHAVDVEISTFPISLNEALARNSKRTFDRVPDEVVVRFYDQFRSSNIQNELLPAPQSEAYAHHEGEDRPSAVVVDIDGTVAKMTGRSPYDYTRVGEDAPVENVLSIVRALSGTGFIVIFVSGRKSSCAQDTVDWLDKYSGIDDYRLFMRKADDDRPDYIVKNEIYDSSVIPFYNIIMAFDDRDQVVRHVRRRGITVAQVAEGRF